MSVSWWELHAALSNDLDPNDQGGPGTAMLGAALDEAMREIVEAAEERELQEARAALESAAVSAVAAFSTSPIYGDRRYFIEREVGDELLSAVVRLFNAEGG